MPTTPGRVLSLVSRLIDYGKQLAGMVQQRAVAPGFVLFAKPFGTDDLAAALEPALCRRAAGGLDPTPAPIRVPAARGPAGRRRHRRNLP